MQKTNVSLEVAGSTPLAELLSHPARLSGLNTTDTLALEQALYSHVAEQHAHPDHQRVLAHLYRRLREFNGLFDPRLPEVHLRIGAIRPHRFVSEARPQAGNGAPNEIILDERLAFAQDTRIVRQPWPADGLVRLLEDGLLSGMVKMHVLLHHKTDEVGYGGYGPLFCDTANTIRLALAGQCWRGGLDGEVVARNRPDKERQPLGTRWPHNCRPPGYYAPAIDWEPRWHGNSRKRVDPLEGLMRRFLRLAQTGRADTIEVITRNYLDRAQGKRKPSDVRVESGDITPDGEPMPDIRFRPEWLRFNGGEVVKMAQAIVQERLYHLMPILGDALQDAGCEEAVLLRHCRLHTTHSSTCFVLRMILREEEERLDRDEGRPSAEAI